MLGAGEVALAPFSKGRSGTMVALSWFFICVAL